MKKLLFSALLVLATINLEGQVKSQLNAVTSSINTLTTKVNSDVPDTVELKLTMVITDQTGVQTSIIFDSVAFFNKNKLPMEKMSETILNMPKAKRFKTMQPFKVLEIKNNRVTFQEVEEKLVKPTVASFVGNPPALGKIRSIDKINMEVTGFFNNSSRSIVQNISLKG